MSLASILFASEEVGTLIRNEIAAVILLAISAIVAVLSSRLRFPFTVALMVAGFFASGLGEVVAVDVSPELILGLLVPPLLFEATLNLSWTKLRADLSSVLVFALLGTLFGTLVIGFVVHAVLGLPLPIAFAFGALISATDPVAVIAFFKTLGVPKRLAVLVEGESLFNDAVAVVAFTLAVAAAETTDSFSIGGAVQEFFVVSAGGLAIGLGLGYIVSAGILARVDDALIETTTTLALAYGSFLLADEFGLMIGDPTFHLSGILAVAAAGLVVGNVGIKNTSPTTRVTLEHFWELLTYLVNSLVFLFIGLSVPPNLFGRHIGAVGVAIGLSLAVRVVVVYGLSLGIGAARPLNKISLAYQHVMFWGGLRGAISLALALTLTTDVFTPDDVERVQVMTFGVVLFTLLGQGTTMAALIRRLGLAGRADNEITQQRHQARIAMKRAGQAEVARLGADGVLDDDLAHALNSAYARDVDRQTDELRYHLHANPELEVAMLLRARRDAIAAEQSALASAVMAGLVDSTIAHDLAPELNNRLVALDLLEERWESDPDPRLGRLRVSDDSGR
ncbi:MAG: Na+/H+ antiporter [Acidimicrobiales bacterium]